MGPDHLRKLLARVAAGETGVEEALQSLETLPYDQLRDSELGYARLDLHRELRSGLPEAVFGSGKTIDDLRGIVTRLLEANGHALVTRLDSDKARALVDEFEGAQYNERAGLVRWGGLDERAGRIAVLAAGTSDLPVAEECAETLAFAGLRVERQYDVGVAGLHRLLAHLEEIRRADAVVAVAGMDGALPTVVAGLVTAPVVAVPTSVGYGASFEGVAPLLTMLTGCAPGVGIVNIDNGYGAAVLAARIVSRANVD
ncbi:MAG: nickel pincer cofactor biosynthesis protein LarB [Acidobacteriota bacterium]